MVLPNRDTLEEEVLATENRSVGGSIPPLGTSKIKQLENYAASR
jgi:hypothetical protein